MPPKYKPGYHRLAINLPKASWEKVKQLSERTRVIPSEIVRNALDSYLAEAKQGVNLRERVARRNSK